MSSPNVVWQQSEVSREQRWAALATRGATVWITGLPASGKSTIAGALEAALVRAGRSAYRLDGDNLRHGVCADLGFSVADRERNITRVGEVAALFADAGTISVVALVSPLRACREAVRRRHDDERLPFVEVFVDTPLEVCAARDPKGLYARARAGEITGFTGVDDPYEPPAAPELVLPGEGPVATAVDTILRVLDGKLNAAPAASLGEALR